MSETRTDACYWGKEGGCAKGPRMCSFCESWDRDAELATLREQLADAVKVIEAAREWRHGEGWIETPQDDALVAAVDDYDAKHGK